MPGVVIGFVLHFLLVLVALALIESRWPALHVLLKAVVISLLVLLFAGVFHRWLCGWLC